MSRNFVQVLMTPEERLQAFSKIEKSLQKARQKVDELLEKEGERL